MASETKGAGRTAGGADVNRKEWNSSLAMNRMVYDAWQKDDGFVPVEIQLIVGRLPLAGISLFWAFARGKLAAAGEKSQGMTYEITCWTGHLTVRIVFTKLVPTSSWARVLFIPFPGFAFVFVHPSYK